MVEEDPGGAGDVRGVGVGVVLGSAFDDGIPRALGLGRHTVATPFGPQELFSGTSSEGGRPVVVLHRHGSPHTRLPHEIDFRAQAWALAAAGCGAVVLNSSVGVLDPRVPVGVPLLATDLLMPENRLPDGSLCTLFTPEAVSADPGLAARRGHLVLSEGIFSRELAAQLTALDQELRGEAATLPTGPDPLVFVYAPGPRTKTPAENLYWAALGGQVNSMSVGPEAVLLGELGIACAALVVGHKRSGGTGPAPGREALARSLEEARAASEALLLAFLRQGAPVASGNHLYRFGPPEGGGEGRSAEGPGKGSGEVATGTGSRSPDAPLTPEARYPMPPTGEEVTILAEAPGFRVERIVSRGHTTPEGHWYDQDALEWVTLLSGQARLRLLDPEQTVTLAPGDTLLISPHRRHRVEWTLPGEETVWIAVFHAPTGAPAEG
jgi:5'-methylthioadenosine phosphorylase